MKKLALCLMTFILCVCSVGATEFVPSVTNGGAPDVVTTNVNGEEIVGYVVDENGGVMYNENGARICDSEGISSEVNLWMIIVWFFKNLLCTV